MIDNLKTEVTSLNNVMSNHLNSAVSCCPISISSSLFEELFVREFLIGANFSSTLPPPSTAAIILLLDIIELDEVYSRCSLWFEVNEIALDGDCVVVKSDRSLKVIHERWLINDRWHVILQVKIKARVKV